MKLYLILFGTLAIKFALTAQFEFKTNVIYDETHFAKDNNLAISADIDGDGHSDLITFSSETFVLAWHKSIASSGAFETRRIISKISTIINLYTIDLDGDGDLDILAGIGGNSQRSAWFENLDGLGTFSKDTRIPVQSSFLTSLIHGDVDGDGDEDVIWAGGLIEGSLEWYEHLDGQGTFSEKKIILSDIKGIFSMALVDLDTDGDKDLTFHSNSETGGQLSWLENLNGLGDFSDPLIIADGFHINNKMVVLSEDVDSDGDFDLVLSSEQDAKVVWFENTNSSGSFSSEKVIKSGSLNAKALKAIDFDNDNDVDLVFAYNSGGFEDFKIELYENIDGLGNFQFKEKISEGHQLLFSIFIKDLNADDKFDIIYTSFNYSGWSENQGDMGFSETIDISTRCGSPNNVLVEDLDGDGDRDIVVSCSSGNRIEWFKNTNGKGKFNVKETIINPDTEVTSVAKIHTADIDGDGDTDLISTANVSVGTPMVIWYENFDGAFLPNSAKTVTSEVAGPWSVHTEDLDGDGDLDVAIAGRTDNTISWCENMDGDGNFGSLQVISNNALKAKSVFAADLDGDGFIDMISGSADDGKIAWYKNLDGQGQFSNEKIISTSAGQIENIYAGDIDQDGDIDILCNSWVGETVTWYENTSGQGDFSLKQVVSTITTVNAFLKDIDEDGDLDILASHWTAGEMAWYENTDGLGGFGTKQVIIQSQDILIDSKASDIDQDGDLDFVSITNPTTDEFQLAWHANTGADENEIKGTIRVDSNLNGCDNNDDPVRNLKISTTKGGANRFSTFSVDNGIYQLFPGEGTFVTKALAPTYFSVDPNSHTNFLAGLGNTVNADFCISPLSEVNDLQVVLLPLADPRPGFQTGYELVFSNIGNTELSGSVSVEYDGDLIDLISTSQPASSLGSSTIRFDFNALSLFETRRIKLNFKVALPPTVSLDDILEFDLAISPNNTDQTPNDNFFTLKQRVVDSFDPNDISVLEGREIAVEELDEYLHYLIRFQNTGTASAIDVRVSQVLDQNLDWASLTLDQLSHEARVEIVNENEISFNFEDIFLPDSTSNEAASHGFIAYKIKPKISSTVGDSIQAVADIFFDFNLPIETNLATTIITENQVSSIDKRLNEFNFFISPIPTSDDLIIHSEESIASIEIYNRIGQMVLVSHGGETVNISELNNGIYFCKITDQRGRQAVKKIVKE